MKKSIFYFSILTALLMSCSKDEEKDDVQGNLFPCYSNTNPRTLTHNNISREYILYIPSSYNGSSTVPLMLNFHGFGDYASNFMLTTSMQALAESDTFIIAYPQGSCADGSSHWNPCPVGSGNKSAADDIGFVETMINEISSQYNVDNKRIYAAGYSNGGMMAYGLAHYKSNLIAAVASVSGAMLDCSGSINHPMPVVHLHGTNDQVIPYNGNSSYSSAPSTLSYWINFNNTNTTATLNTDNTGGITIEHYVYDQGDNNVSVEHYKYIGGGHDWFNQTYQNQNASQLVWNFVSRYDINGLR